MSLSLKPYSFLFFSTLILGIFISMSSSNWFMIWMGLELNLYSFIPLLLLSKMNQEKEASIKYFLTQALASAILLFSALMAPFSIISKLMLSSALFMKLGMAPFHFWFPSVMNAITWQMCWVLSTVQKIAPMTLLIFNSPMYQYAIYVAGISAMVGGCGGLLQTQMRAIFAYSSIGHMGWILTASLLSSTISLFYFFSYLLMISSIMASFVFITPKSSNYSMNFAQMNTIQIITILSILSLGGMPPLFGFFPKMFVVMLLAKSNMIAIAFILLISSTINLYYYIKILMGLFFSAPNTQPWINNSNMKNNMISSSMFLATMTLALVSPMLIPYSFYALTLLY